MSVSLAPSIVARSETPEQRHARLYAAFMAAVAGLETPVAGLGDLVGSGAPQAVRAASSLEDGQRVVDSAGYGYGAREGRSFFLELSPGTVAVRAEDESRRVRSEDRRRVLKSRRIDDLRLFAAPGEVVPAMPPSRVVTSWSRRSRSRMVRAIASLDFSTWSTDTGTLCMLTLTLPGDWLTVAPTGKAFKRLVELFRRRFVRATGLPWQCIWKLEFQRRGAPHWHALMRLPALIDGLPAKIWISKTWANVVAHPDPVQYLNHLGAGTRIDYSGSKFSDPRRISVYFLGHSMKYTDGKEYQHVVPEEWQVRGAGPGRFWGVSGIPRGTLELEISLEDFVRVRRVMRKLGRARQIVRNNLRTARGLAPLPVRKSWTLGSNGALTGGWVMLNDGVGFSLVVPRLLEHGSAPANLAGADRSRLVAATGAGLGLVV